MNTLHTNSALPKIAILGSGSMGGAILAGLTGHTDTHNVGITVTTHSAKSAKLLTESIPGITAYAAATTPDANRLAVAGAGIVLLAVKPWLIHDVLREIADSLSEDAIVVSVAAGVTIDSMQALVPSSVTVMRAMPNTPAHVGRGITGLSAQPGASEHAIDLVRAMLRTVGEVLVVDESRINAVAAVSGSGPAYLYLYIEEMIAAATELGFSHEEAALLVQQTVIGAAELLQRSDETPEQLRRNVTSPNGTTERAVAVLEQGHLRDLFFEALAANIRRSEELAQGS